MQLIIKNLHSILDSKLTLTQRGILITILLCKDEDQDITMLKFKKQVKISDIKDDLIKLQNYGLIKWKGFPSAKSNIQKAAINNDIVDVITFMNNLYGRGFDAKSASSTNNLIPRLKENDIEDVKLVIANRYAEWKDDAIMSKHLNPGTIFRKSKFDKYLEEAKRSRKGESFVAAENINLSHGDEITKEISQTFIKTDTYNIKIYQTDGDGNSRGIGVMATRYGKDIQKMITLQEMLQTREHRYFYVKK